MTKKSTDEVLKSYSILKVIYGSSNYDSTYRYTTDDLLGNWEKEYYSPIPTLLIGGLKNLGCLKELDEILVKDGALGVIRFFRMYPEVPNWFNTKFYIKRNLAGLIPKAWESHIVIYDDWFKGSEVSRNELVIHGVLAKGVCCFENFSKDLSSCLERNQIHKIHVILRTPVKMEGYFDEDETYGLNEFLNILMGKVESKTMVNFYKLDDIEKINFSNSLYLPIDSSGIVSSSLSSEVTMFSKGAIRYGETMETKQDVVFNENYGLSILGSEGIGAHRSKIEKIESEMASAVNSYTDLDIALLLLT